MPRIPFLALLALLLPLCTTTASVPREEYEVEINDLRGTWRVNVVKVDGMAVSGPEKDEWCLVVRQNRVTLTSKDARNFFKIDPGRRPAHIDLLADGRPGAKVMRRGIYRLSGSRLTICWGRRYARPKAFVSRRSTLVEFVRVK